MEPVPAQAGNAGIGKWLSVDPVNYITWSSYTFSFNRPITVYDPNGASGEDMTKTGKDIAAKKYYYCWGGKNPDNAYLQIGKKKFKNFDQILKKASLSMKDDKFRIYDSNKKKYVNGRRKSSSESFGWDFGYDCSGVVCAINNENPDRSMTFDPGIYNAMSAPGLNFLKSPV
jgi:hypothetical protein